jgi:hypothetical protein
MNPTIATPRRLRALLALTAVTVLLLTGCGDSDDDAAPDGGQRPGIEQGDDASPSAVPTDSGSEPADAPTEPAGASDQPTADHSPADVDLDDFPLAAGWPEDGAESGSAGLEVPVKKLDDPFDEATCGAAAPAPRTTDALRGQFFDVEAYLSRELLVFPDADAAVAYVSALDDFYATDACTAQDAAGGEATYPLRRVATKVGGQSFTVVRGTELEGEAQVGMSALQVVRVGRSVLLDTTAGEGLVRDTKDARDLAASMTDRAADVVAAQCAFSAAGC